VGTDRPAARQLTSALSADLTSTECQILCHAAEGLTAVESARQLGKSHETVKTQRSQILLKLGARNLANAVSIGVMTGIVTLK
jgi:DNA-binding CsgD family transcriptional regulator